MDLMNKMKADFERMLSKDIVGRNWNCDLIPDIGNGFPETGHSISTRCICFSKDGRQEQPTIRTSHTDAIRRGDLIYIPDYDSGTFYLLEATPQLEPNCYSTKGTRCNALVTICEAVPAQTDDYGYTVTEAAEREILHNLPAVVRHSQTINTGTAAAGMFVEDELALTMQKNDFSEAVPLEAYFDLDGTRYSIIDRVTDGTITYICKWKAGIRT